MATLASVLLPDALCEAARKYAQTTGRTFSGLVKIALEEHLSMKGKGGRI